jgi:hypothetical protein
LVEVLEYSLVFLAASMLAGFSLLAVSSYSSSAEGLEDRAAFSGLSSAAWFAVEHGNSSATLPVANASVACIGGRLTLSSQGYSGLTDLPVGCDFDFGHLDGPHVFSFESSRGWLELEVT